MARYTGPKWKINRRENATVLGDESWKRRPTPPGQHGVSKGRPSNYAIQFREKQKVKKAYGLLEKQFRRFYAMAQKATGNTGLRFLQLLEMRLDNVVYRMKFAKTRMESRQIVAHGHVMVNGKKIDIPSYIVKVGDKIEIDKKIREGEAFKSTQIQRKTEVLPKWLRAGSIDGEIVAEPVRDEIDGAIREQLIVELYSRYNIK